MNFLAHLTLSHFSADLQVGNFIGDFIRGRELAALPPGIRRGVLFHRDIDALTDADPGVRQLNDRLKLDHGRYAPVISDIAFDYFLYLNWAEWGPQPFGLFKATAYRRLLDARPHLSERITGYVEDMTRGDWLEMYTSPENMHAVYDRLTGRLSQPDLLSGVDETLIRHASRFNHALHGLFPRLQQLADTYRD
ncbi:acyl carrier protein phosphodiesterase [Neolewinella xylanilytica]|uniref:Acyl carrier protein phosphodiesterase n=1 Tax=Neolewinella xylanilytica TaxID=1514080 RepID=A0A2S6I6B8_9BACT|nr:ACP phosphodiesterase [Neolewinella xylanilytica]PPK86717.1 acyl carrier protein phosphodiesterase [Neolewinella xylanilytica]